MEELKNIRVRFAPSPTGEFHLGNARTALFNWLYAKKYNGKFILRIEDTDRERSKNIYQERLLSILKWMGIEWDEGFDCGGEYGPYCQSDRNKFYQEALEKLIDSNHAYRCFCTQEHLEEVRSQYIRNSMMPRYNNHCRSLTEEEVNIKLKEKAPFVWRFRVGEEKIAFKDEVRGLVEFDPQYIGDFVIARSDGSSVFHLAVTVDDAMMKISHVIRGEDHLSNTPKHIMLFRALGAPVPTFAHLPMIIGDNGKKLSKRDSFMVMQSYIDRGYLSDAVVNYMAMLGWSPKDDREILTRQEMISLFDLPMVSRSPAMFNPDKLNWFNSKYISSTQPEKLLNKVFEIAKKDKLITSTPSDDESYERFLKIFKLIRGQLDCLADFTQEASYFIKESSEEKQTFQNLVQEKGAENVIKMISILQNHLQKTEWDEDSCRNILKETQKELELKGKNFFLPIRVILTGRLHGPELYCILFVMGKESVEKRLRVLHLRLHQNQE